MCISCGLHHPLCLIGDDSPCHERFTVSEGLQMPKDQGEACFLLSFSDFFPRLARSLGGFHVPSLPWGNSSFYVQAELASHALQFGATLHISELRKGTGNIQMASATSQDKGWPSMKPNKTTRGHNTQKEAWRTGEPTGHQVLQHLC